MRSGSFKEIAKQTMLERGFIPDFSPEISLELATIQHPAKGTNSMRDTREWMWVSIDNETSEDLDQLTYAEGKTLYIAVADVDALVKKGSAIDQRAAQNTTSVYTPVLIFPMLPLKLSTNLTSLNEKTDRCALVVEVQVEENGHFDLKDIYQALVRNQAKLDYPCVGALLEHRVCKHALPALPGLKEQLLLQDELAQKIYSYRCSQGTLEFKTIQLQAIVVDDIPVSLEEQERNRAHRLIENCMIAANVAVTRYLKKRNLPTIRRIVKKPKRWGRIVALAKTLGEVIPPQPDAKALRQFLLKQKEVAPLQFPDLSLAIIKLLGRGEYVLGLPDQSSLIHFDLAEQEYSHTTAPNRRFADLIMQRLLKSALFQTEIPYTRKELSQIAQHCTEKETDADKVERKLIKCAAASVLQKEIGKSFDAMVTGAAPKGTWVRLFNPPIEGKLVKGFQGVDVGDFIKVKLIKVDVFKGHIDFIKI
jgi:exoribonuclease-2